MSYRRLKRVDFIVVHCSAHPAGSDDVGAATIDRIHRALGWRRGGYHYVIPTDGTVEKGRPDDMPGAHERRVNSRSISVCMIGGSPPIGSREHRRGLGENNFTDEQWFALAKVVQVLTQEYPDAEVLGHRDIPGVRKACPSFDARSWWARVKQHIELTGELPTEVIRGE